MSAQREVVVRDETVVEDEEPQPTPPPLGRTLVAILVSWTALVAVPGALPWAATEDVARALAYAIAAATVVAAIGIVVSMASDERKVAATGAQIASAASTIAIFLAALEVVNLMLVPADAPYREVAIAIGLLLLLAVALLTASGGRWSLFEGFRFSSISLVGSVVGLALVGVYLLVVQGLFGRTGPQVLDPEWIRIQDLLAGLQALAFAAAGALLGTAVQAQVTSNVASERNAAETANDELDETVTELADDAAAGRLLRVSAPTALRATFESAVLADHTRYIDNPSRLDRRVNSDVQSVTATPPEQLATELRASLSKARMLRRRSR